MVHSAHEFGVPTPTPLSCAYPLPILHSGPALRLAASDVSPSLPSARILTYRLSDRPTHVLYQESL